MNVQQNDDDDDDDADIQVDDQEMEDEEAEEGPDATAPVTRNIVDFPPEVAVPLEEQSGKDVVMTETTHVVNSGWTTILADQAWGRLQQAVMDRDGIAIQSILVENRGQLDLNQVVIASDSADGKTLLHVVVAMDWFMKEDSPTTSGQDAKGAPPAVVRGLLEHGAHVNVRNVYGQTPLHLAMKHHRGELVRLLLEQGADVRSLDSSGLTPLHWAVDHDFVHVWALDLPVLAHDEVKDIHGRSPLHYACQSDQHDHPKLASVQALLQNGADPTRLDEQGRTALHIAVACLDLDLLQVLLTFQPLPSHHHQQQQQPGPVLLQRMNINMKDAAQRTVLAFCLEMDLHYVSLHRDKYQTMVNLILDHPELDVNCQDDQGRTCLHLAVTSDCLLYGSSLFLDHVLCRLLERGIDVNRPEHTAGETALMLACRRGCGLDMIRRLVQGANGREGPAAAAADLQLRNHQGYTALELTFHQGQHDEQGRQPNDEDEDEGGHRLHLYADITWFLLRPGAVFSPDRIMSSRR